MAFRRPPFLASCLTLALLAAAAAGQTQELSGNSIVLDLRAIPSAGPVRDWWYRRHPVRSIAALYSAAGGDDHFIGQTPALSYDGLIFVDSAAAARPNPALARR